MIQLSRQPEGIKISVTMVVRHYVWIIITFGLIAAIITSIDTDKLTYTTVRQRQPPPPQPKAVVHGTGKEHPERQKRPPVNEDLSWLNHIRLGPMLGKGSYTYGFEAIFDQPMDEQYVIKITGNYADGKSRTSGIARAELAVEIVDRLSPSPNIPGTLHFVKSIPNPFWTNTTHSLEFGPDFEDSYRKRVLTCTNISITVSERAIATHRHIGSDDALKVPASKVRCFWRRLFELLDNVHRQNIMIYDTKLWNFMLTDGDIIMFDWNMGKIFVPNNDTGRVTEYGRVSPPKYQTVHEHDVRKFGLRIVEFLERQESNLKKGKHLWEIVSETDRKLLANMKDLMQDKQRTPPTLKWLLDHHEYFAIERDDSCFLEW